MARHTPPQGADPNRPNKLVDAARNERSIDALDMVIGVFDYLLTRTAFTDEQREKIAVMRSRSVIQLKDF